jgi:hypothetical protein
MARKKKRKRIEFGSQSIRNRQAARYDQQRTDGAGERHASLTWFESEEAAVPGRDAYAPAEVRADSKYGAVRGEERALAARGASRRVPGRPRVGRAAPERVFAHEGRQRLRHVRLPDADGACCAQRHDDLLIGDGTTDGNDRTVSYWEVGKG